MIQVVVSAEVMTTTPESNAALLFDMFPQPTNDPTVLIRTSSVSVCGAG